MVDPASLSFIEGISVEAVDGDRFSARYPHWWEGDRVFGGFVVAQAAAAAMATVDRPDELHSLHGYFLRPAAAGSSSTISVERVRDGRSFTTRRTSTEVAGKETFVMTASFHGKEEGEEYQVPMAEVASPTDAGPVEVDGPIELIEIGPTPMREDGTYLSTRRAWLRVAEELGDDPARHLAAAAYCSDMTRAAFRPRSLGTWGEHVDASLDHSLWFHRMPDMSRWHLFDIETSVTHAGRSFMRARLSDEAGALVVSMAQEILIRRIAGAEPIAFDDPTHLPSSP